MTISTFKNHKEAGKLLAQKINAHVSSRALVLAIPHGGVPVAIEVSEQLKAPLDTIAVTKIPAPLNPELGIGAVAIPNIVIIDPFAQESFDISDKELQEFIEQQKVKLNSMAELFKTGVSSEKDYFETVILIDDGYATGTVIKAAAQSIQKVYKPRTIIFATPICTKDISTEIKGHVDTIICLSELDDLIAINLWYDEVEPISQNEVIEMLTARHHNH